MSHSDAGMPEAWLLNRITELEQQLREAHDQLDQPHYAAFFQLQATLREAQQALERIARGEMPTEMPRTWYMAYQWAQDEARQSLRAARGSRPESLHPLPLLDAATVVDSWKDANAILQTRLDALREGIEELMTSHTCYRSAEQDGCVDYYALRALLAEEVSEEEVVSEASLIEGVRDNSYRKKPVVIEAWPIAQLVHDAEHEWSALPLEVRAAYEAGILLFSNRALLIKTLEGDHRGDLTDWLIQGVKGEFYPCKPDIFAATYEPVDSLSPEEREG